jgi:hypothetical protein
MPLASAKGAGARRSSSTGLRFRHSSPQRGGGSRCGGEESAGGRVSVSPPRGGLAPPPLDVDALVRGRYYAHVTSQVFLSNLPPWVRPLSRAATTSRAPSPGRSSNCLHLLLRSCR